MGRIAAVVATAVFLCTLVLQCFADNYPFDLAYFTAAGRMWGAGLDPYGTGFARFGAPYIARDVALWAYPPQWWSVTVALATLDKTSAVIAWKIVNITALAAGGFLIHDALRKGRANIPFAASLLFATALASADATRITLHLGQSSLLILLGFALLVHGLRFGGEGRKTFGVVLLLLKPQFGLFFLFLMAIAPAGRKAAAFALLLTVILCLPVLVTLGLQGTIESAGRFLSNLSAYNVLPWNRPGELTGLSFAAALLGLPAPPPLVCISAALGLTLWLCRGTSDPVRLCLVGLAALYAIAPLHPYDLTLLPVFLLLLTRLRLWAAWCIVGAAFISWHASTSAFSFYGNQTSEAFDGIFIASILQAGAATLASLLVLAAMGFGRRPLASARLRR